MKKILFILLFSPLLSLGQNQNVIVPRQLVPKRVQEFNIIKEKSFEYDKVKGFVLQKLECPLLYKPKFIKIFKDCFEETPFVFIVQTYNSTRNKKREEGYIYISQSSIMTDNNNFVSTWIFKDHNKKTLYAFDTVNIGIIQVLADIGITTY